MLSKNTILDNRYRIVYPLGEGGMGAVYLAEDLKLRGHRVALKQNKSGTPRQFETEAVLLANLRHPNLPRVFDHFSAEDGFQYLVMDYIEGMDLAQIVEKQGTLPEAKALHWFGQILDAVSYLHASDILHRDIKPRNIIITPDDHAVLVDFGIAKVNASTQATSTSIHSGSPGFASPEQYAGGTTVRSDIYSLGALLYYILTGTNPPESPQRSAGVELRAPRAVRSSISPQTEQVILKALNLDARQRYSHVSVMAEALRAKTDKGAKPGLSINPLWLLGAIITVAILVFLVFYFATQSPFRASNAGNRSAAPNSNVPTGVSAITPNPPTRAIQTVTLVTTMTVAPTFPNTVTTVPTHLNTAMFVSTLPKSTQIPPTVIMPLAIVPIKFESGATTANVSGVLAANGAAIYSLEVSARQDMTLALATNNAGGHLKVLMPNGAPLTPQQGNAEGTFWRANLPISGIYRVQVMAGSGVAMNYSLAVTIPARVRFATGAISATVLGNTRAARVVTYLLRANGGQTMTINLNAPAGAAALAIYGMQGGQSLARTQTGATSFDGILPATQDYVIEVVPTGSAPFNFSLDIRIV